MNPTEAGILRMCEWLTGGLVSGKCQLVTDGIPLRPEAFCKEINDRTIITQ